MDAEKHVKLNFSAPVKAEQLATYGKVVRHDGLEAELQVPRDCVADAAQRILANLPIADIGIEDPPIEAVIGAFMAMTAPGKAEAS